MSGIYPLPGTDVPLNANDTVHAFPLTLDVTFNSTLRTVNDVILMGHVLADMNLPPNTALDDEHCISVSIETGDFQLSHPSTLTVKLA